LALLSNKGRKMKYIILKSCVELGADEATALKGYGRIDNAPEPKPVKAPTDRAAKPKTTRAKKS